LILLDTNTLIYAFTPDDPLSGWAEDLISRAVADGGAAINPVVLAELAVGDADPATLADRLTDWGITCLSLTAEVAPLAASAYRRYLSNRQRRGAIPAAPRVPLPDFFIGAQAAWLELPIATADAGRYQKYFPTVQLLLPD
jgi:predicted nucleic acid-binding protein